MKVNPFVNTEEELKREIAADVMADEILLLRRENAEMKAFIADLLNEAANVDSNYRNCWIIEPGFLFDKYPWLEAYLDR